MESLSATTHPSRWRAWRAIEPPADVLASWGALGLGVLGIAAGLLLL